MDAMNVRVMNPGSGVQREREGLSAVRDRYVRFTRAIVSGIVPVTLIVLSLGVFAPRANAVVIVTLMQDTSDAFDTIWATDTGQRIPDSTRSIFVPGNSTKVNVAIPSTYDVNGTHYVTTDAHSEHGWGVVGTGTWVNIAAVNHDPGTGLFAEIPLNDFLLPLGSAGVSYPWMGSTTSDLYYSVNLVPYIDGGGATYDESGSTTFQIVNGTSLQLPGMLFGTSDVTFAADSGYTTANPYTGSVTVWGEQNLSAVPTPEPATAAMGLVALCGLGLATLRRGKSIA